SGGSAGVFGPSVGIGGGAGGSLGLALHDLAPALVPHPASFVVVGAGRVFAAPSQTPPFTLVIRSGVMGNFGPLLPGPLVWTLSFLLSDQQSIYHEQVVDRLASPVHGGIAKQAMSDQRER